mmetsp:Transcript_29773/g.65184  ORF Transcript_29773/g.65184 Transcript_29773/m.65184 type:complete len:279 (-) Transcript_29773:260-1096(-)
MGDESTEVGHTESGDRHLSTESVVPGNLVGTVLTSVGVIELNVGKSGGFHVLDDLTVVHKSGEGVSDLDSFLDTHVVLVVGIVGVKHHPLVTTELSTFLEHAVDATEALHTVRGVAGGFDLIGRVEGVGIKGKVLEVALGASADVVETHGGIVLVTNVHLVLVNGDTSDIGTTEDSNVSHGSTHSTSDIQHLHARLKAETRGKVVLSTLDGLHEGFVLVARSKVKGLAPTIFVEVSHNVVKVIHHLGVSVLSLIDGFVSGDGTSLLASTIEHTLVVNN